MRLPGLEADQCYQVHRDAQANAAGHPNRLHGTAQ